MSKSLLFYVIPEWTDTRKYCKRKKLKPHKSVIKTLDDYQFEDVTQYSKDGYIYYVLEYDNCPNGFMQTIMRLPQLPYEELLDVALTSKNYGERYGAIGIILKYHPSEFEQYLSSVNVECIKKRKEQIQLKRMVAFINSFAKTNSGYVRSLENILSLCEKIEYLL